ncbi:MAG: hypothetical protein SP1CHLAM54_12590 [Chlamydiia bacterium]|nr:hypothetical protein [Chlamydiia bacterium]MCH9616157.1 hypothetical protein [Chlamydiia bacterium]MCH9629857.1 hypothetical protein [Chlamydiia bacterium]
MNASRYVHIQLLVSDEEMKDLFETLTPFELYNVSQVTKEPLVEKEIFLNAYRSYFEAFQKGEIEIDRPLFSLALTRDQSAVTQKELPDGRVLTRIVKPVIQMRAHSYTIAGGKLHTMTFGTDAISWGIQLSFPHLYEDVVTGEVKDTLKSGSENIELFKALRVWVRNKTKPTTLDIEGNAIKTPLRKGSLV